MRPAIVIHGIFDPAIRVLPLVRGLRARGIEQVRRARVPVLGNTRIEELAQLLAARVERVREQHGAEQVDLVGYSMGALVARTYLQWFAGQQRVSTFVSICGPHRGTFTAYALPLVGIRQMRPGSAFLTSLGHDVSQLPSVRVHCLYTPYDAMIVPATSGILDGAASVHRMPVSAHHRMLRDARVHDLVAQLLLADVPARQAA
ncbi:MAG TPA: alpha/beta fold hydrolase [Polyangiales bacterium]|nr:alpha/beta fold hydrolase [Polyangiales bacterium]